MFENPRAAALVPTAPLPLRRKPLSSQPAIDRPYRTLTMIIFGKLSIVSALAGDISISDPHKISFRKKNFPQGLDIMESMIIVMVKNRRKGVVPSGMRLC